MPLPRKRPLRCRLLRGLFACGGVLLLGAFVMGWVGARLIAAENHPVGAPPDDLPLEKFQTRSDSLGPIAGWRTRTLEAPATVLLLHPLHADRRAMLGRARLLHRAGYDVALIDLPGHGETVAENLAFGWRGRLAVSAALRRLREDDPDRPIGVIGWSLGGASALLASPLGPEGVDAVVLESVYPTIRQAVHNRLAMRVGPAAGLIRPFLLCQLPLRLGSRWMSWPRFTALPIWAVPCCCWWEQGTAGRLWRRLSRCTPPSRLRRSWLFSRGWGMSICCGRIEAVGSRRFSDSWKSA